MHVLITINHPPLRHAIRAVIKDEFHASAVQTATTEQDARHIVSTPHIDGAIFRIRLWDHGGLRHSRQIKHVQPSVTCLVLHLDARPHDTWCAMVHEASGDLITGATPEELRSAVRVMMT